MDLGVFGEPEESPLLESAAKVGAPDEEEEDDEGDAPAVKSEPFKPKWQGAITKGEFTAQTNI